jgi:hypothetical protein
VAAMAALIEYTLRVSEVSADELRELVHPLGPTAKLGIECAAAARSRAERKS